MKKHNSFKMKLILSTWMLIVTLGMFAQNISVRGKITDSGDKPVIGATVVVAGAATNGTVTDIDGNYSLSNLPASGSLVFSYVGMQTQTIAIKGQTVINVVLSADVELLDEIVVVGYGTQKKVNLTGAVSVADQKVLENRPITNLGQGLQGAIPNLQVTQGNYAPGQGSSFNIRGFTSLNGGGPLVLVDGVVQDPNLINPNDVESVSVLKDAA